MKMAGHYWLRPDACTYKLMVIAGFITIDQRSAENIRMTTVNMTRHPKMGLIYISRTMTSFAHIAKKDLKTGISK